MARILLLVSALAALLLPSSIGSARAQDAARPSRADARTYIVTLDVADSGRLLDPAARGGRQRMQARARQTRGATSRLEHEYDFRASQRYHYAVSGFAARLTSGQVARLRRDGAVATVRPARRYRIASQSVPVGIRRVQAAPSGIGSVDADIAVVDTGIGPVGGGELDIRGGINCSGDGLGPNQWSDAYRSRHGTHVAGIAAARDNGVGVVGVAPGARLWSVRVFRANGYGDEATIICGLEWVLSTVGPTPPPGSQPIEVVNMSLEGPRPSDDPEGCTGRPTPDPDAMHLAVCAVHAAGVTIVAAAGNDGIDARYVSPAGYDQVITVGALNDFDGRPGGRADAVCGSAVLGGDIDDRYARYSNRGSDVDLLAPGTCVLSTLPSASGDATQRLTGTSMAAPHVSGAVARYLAAKPSTEPERMRRIVRASGGLGWIIASDPDWDGPRDPSAPRRLLDVAALLGPPGLRAWVTPRTFVADERRRPRHARVDVQRIGGYDADLTLGVEGLPSDVGRHAFSPSGALGLADAGARLTLRFDPAAPEDRYTLRIDASSGPRMRGRSMKLRVDRSGPVIRGIRLAFTGSPARADARTRKVRVRWSVHDALGAVGRTALLRRVGSGRWQEVAAGQGLEQATTTVKVSRRTSLRVVARDDLGNVTRSDIREVRPADGEGTAGS